MTERRPHWDTELEQSVSAILFDCYNNGVSEEQVYQAIAAVEDWVLSAPIFDLYLSRKHAPDKAAIQRVRELHRPCSDPHLHDGSRCCLECSDYGRQGVVRMYPCDTLNALEGDSGDPTGT